MLLYKNHQFISKSEAQCSVEQLISNFGEENTITAVELIKLPSGSVSFMSNESREQEVLVVIGGCGTVSNDKQSFFVNQGEIISVEANTMRSLSNIDEGFVQVISIRYKSTS